MPSNAVKHVGALFALILCAASSTAADEKQRVAFFEKKIRPILVEHCYKCHSEAEKKQRGGLLLDRPSGWLKGGDTGKAVVPGDLGASLLIKAVRRTDDDLKMPPRSALEEEDVRLLEAWVKSGAAAPSSQSDSTAFSRLGDQKYLFGQAKKHWAFQPVRAVDPPRASDPAWNDNAIDRFVFAAQAKKGLEPARPADARTLVRRLSYDLTGLPPTPARVEKFVAEHRQDAPAALNRLVDELIASSAFGEHFGRMWLDVARYADTDSFYRPDTKTPHYFPFAFTYRDYVIASFNADKPHDRFIREQLAADLLGLADDAPELAALGFLAVGPHANRNQAEALDDWIDVTTRGLMGLTAACARCHDHKYEPIPTADYYSLRGVFDSVNRIHPLDEKNMPVVRGYQATSRDAADYEKKRAAIENKIKAAGGKKKGQNRIDLQLRDTELAELLLFHPGAPARAMVVKEKGKPSAPYVFLRGDPKNRGANVPRRFLQILDPDQQAFPDNSSGRLALVDKIVARDNPLTARVFVNRVWGVLMGSHLVDTPSDFGLQGTPPTHPELLDWLAEDFMAHGWSTKRLVRTIALTQVYRQRSDEREAMAAQDPANKLLWRANRKHLSIEALRDSLLAVAGNLERTPRGRPGQLWGKDYTRRRTIYGYINRFNLDPTLRTFGFPTPMQSQPARGESIVPTQVLFTLNSPFAIDQARAITATAAFKSCQTDEQRIDALFQIVLQRPAGKAEVSRIIKFVERHKAEWPLIAQSLLMSNEFQYVD